MKRLLTILVALLTSFSAFAQAEKSIIIEQKSFRPVQTDALTGVNIDPIGLDYSKRPCARLKVKINRMTKAEIDGIEVKPITNNAVMKCKTAEYDNGLIIEMTAKPQTRFYFHHNEFGDSNEVIFDLEADKEYYLEAYLNQTFSIIVNSNVAGAAVYIDDKYCGETSQNQSLTVKDVMIGSHTLQLEYGKIKHTQTIEVNSGSISFRQNVNIAGSKPQYVVFAVEPQNTAITIDGQLYVAEDGVVTALLENGTHTYKAEARGYHPQSGTFTVSGAKVELPITLKGDFANVTLAAENGADIYINDKKVGTTTWFGRLNSGLYLFEARKSGYRTESLSKQITSAEPEQSYNFPALTPIYGSADIVSVPAMAEITIDGKSVGRTPLLLDNLLVGEHTIRISKEGYQPYSTKIIVVEGKSVAISAAMDKQTAQNRDSSSIIGNIEMVFVEGGTFTMGATAEQGKSIYGFEKPTHQVTVSDFYIGKYEVTQAQWRAVMGDNPSRFKGDNRPVEDVSWSDIQQFLAKLNAQTGKNYRLPTEAEWEYAARGGSKSQGYKYSGSNKIKDVAWYKDNSDEKTHPVGQKLPNELGLYDMSGNVWEWCSDWFGSYSGDLQTNPTGPITGDSRAFRGGDWFDEKNSCCVSHRNGLNPKSRIGYVGGFRLAYSVD